MEKFKRVCKKISEILKKIYGWGILACLFIGGATVLGYIAALIIGGDTAAAICEFIYKEFFYYMFLIADGFVLLGLIAMYLAGEKSMLLQKKKKTAEKAGK